MPNHADRVALVHPEHPDVVIHAHPRQLPSRLRSGWREQSPAAPAAVEIITSATDDNPSKENS